MNKLPTRLLRLRKTAILSSLILLLSACDGGIFGTGDDTTISTVPIESGPPVGNDMTEPEPSPPGSVANPTSPPQVNEPLNTLSFDNLQVGSNQNEPLMTLVNVSNASVNASVSLLDEASGQTTMVDNGTDSSNTLFETAISTNNISDTVELPLGSSELTVFSLESTVESFTVSPLNLGASSVTTLIVRDLPETSNGIEVVPLPAQRLVTDPDVARVRLVQAYALSPIDTPSTVTLVPAGSNPGSNEVSFSVSAQTANSSLYESVNAGSYLLTDALSRFNAIPIDVQAGQIYTLVITQAPVPEIIIQQDSLQTRR